MPLWMMAWFGVGGFVLIGCIAFVEPNGWTVGIVNFFVWGGLAAVVTAGLERLRRRLQ